MHSTVDVSPCHNPVPQLEAHTQPSKKRKRKSAIFVGQAPTEHAEESSAPLTGAAERRLAKLAGVSVERLWVIFDRINVLPHFPGKQTVPHTVTHQSTPDKFPLKAARQAAQALDLDTYSLVILLGNNVARSFK